MDHEKPNRPDFDQTSISIINAIWKNLASWVIATLVLFALIGGVIISPILITAYQVSKEPQNTTLWGWMYMWTEFRDPSIFKPLVCENSQASDLTDEYFAALADIPFEFQNVEAEQIGDNRVRAKAIVECTLSEQEGTDSLKLNWEADFITKIAPPVGLCIAEIQVHIGAELCR